MNVLYINHPESDYGGGFLYNGLCQLLGPKRVFDVPCKWSYHGRTHLYSTRDIEHGETAPFPWMRAWPVPWPEDLAERTEEVVARARQWVEDGVFSLCVIESTRSVAMKTFQALGPSLKASGVPIVLHDGEDFREFRWSAVREIRPSLVLKREFDPEWPEHRVVEGSPVMAFPFSFPFPFPGSDDEGFGPFRDDEEYDYDVAFIAGNTWPSRQGLADALRAETGLCSYVSIQPDRSSMPGNREGLGWREYLSVMRRARMAVSMRGFGHDTCRYWEVPFCSVLVCDAPRIKVRAPFEHGVSCLRYNGIEDCIGLLNVWKERTDDLTKLRRDGRAHLLTNHTNVVRARDMIYTLIERGALRQVSADEFVEEGTGV